MTPSLTYSNIGMFDIKLSQIISCRFDTTSCRIGTKRCSFDKFQVRKKGSDLTNVRLSGGSDHKVIKITFVISIRRFLKIDMMTWYKNGVGLEYFDVVRQNTAKTGDITVDDLIYNK